MKIVVNKKDRTLAEISEPQLRFELNNGEGIVNVWGVVHLYKDVAFKPIHLQELRAMSFRSIIPLLTGQYIAALINNDTINQLSVDFYGHFCAYIQEKKESYCITDDITLVHFDEPYDFDKFQIRHFIDKGYCWASGTFIKQLNKVSPTLVYTFENGAINQDFLPFPTFKKDGTLEDCMADTLEAIVEGSEKVGLFFSSGVDSSYIREVAYRNDIKIIPYQHYMKKPRYFAPEEDLDLSKRLDFGRQDVKVCELEDTDAFFKDTIAQTIRMLPFDFHPALIQSHVYPIMKQDGCKMAISGQNSDSVYALAATHHTPISHTIKQLLTFRLHNSGLKSDFKRYVQTGRFLRKLQDGKPNWWTKLIWNRLNPDYEFSFSNLLMAYMKEDAELPVICHNKNDKLEAEYIAQYQDFVEKLNVLFERGETPRMVMIRGKLLGHCQGRDVRCLTEWAKKYDLGNIQIFTSGPILSWLGTHDLGICDIFVGKRELRRYLEKKIHYSKLKKQVPDYRHMDWLVTSEVQRFHDLYDYMNKNGELDTLAKKSLNMLLREGIISSEEYNNYTSSYYTDNHPRLVWLAQTIENIK